MWNRSAKILEHEHEIYQAAPSTASRGVPSADLWEIYAGKALCSHLANEYSLNALQPWDLIYGQDLAQQQTQQQAMAVPRRFKPRLTMCGLKCTYYCIKNCNYSHRPEEWKKLQKKDKPLLDFAIDVALEQHQSNRFFLLENPQRSELWQNPQVIRLSQMPGVWEIVVDAGAFGATNQSGQPVAKPYKFMGNMPGMDTLLARRLLPHERQQCVPIQGRDTKHSEEYPEALCRAILRILQQYTRQQEPHRFCTKASNPFEAFPVQHPTTDLSQWDTIVQDLDRAYEHTAKRPYYIVPDTPQGRQIQDLLRMDATRIQVVANPTTRQLPLQFYDYTGRACFLIHSDDTRAEQLDEMRFPRQRFTKPVRVPVFVYGYRRLEPESAETSSITTTGVVPAVIPGLPTDVDFPGLSKDIGQEVRTSIARIHCNMGHPSKEELCRLLAHQGDVPDKVYECARKLRCATCERLRPPQQPRPSAMPRPFMGQFGDEVQMDFVYCRTLDSSTLLILGVADRATGLHQARIMPAITTCECFDQMWMRPYGIPLKVQCDPDRAFRGEFQTRLEALGCLVEHCPPEAHHVIGVIERRNALLRLILEKLIDTFAAAQADQCHTLLTATCHALNSGIHTHGRSAYQAVFGRVPRLPDSNFSDNLVLATSTPIAYQDLHDPGFKAAVIRSEALKTLHDLDVNQHLRRALTRKTRNTRVADLQPGQKCAFWRWQRRGPKKRGSWVIGTFLSWDPSHPGKQAQGGTVLVTAEQLRAAFGYEHWTPDKQDIQCLKDASKTMHEHLFDERGPEPHEEQQPLPEDQDIMAYEGEYGSPHNTSSSGIRSTEPTNCYYTYP